MRHTNIYPTYRCSYVWNHDFHVYLDIVTRFRRDFGRERKGLVHDIFTALLLINPKYSRRLRYCFLGDEAVSWLLRRTKVKSVAEAIALGEKMRNDGVFAHICCEKSFLDEKMVYKFAFKDDKETIVHILQEEDIWESDSGELSSNGIITYEMIADSLQNRGFNDAARAFQLIGLLEEKTRAESETMSMSQISEYAEVPPAGSLTGKREEEKRDYPFTDEDMYHDVDSGPQTLSAEEMSEIRKTLAITPVESVSTIGSDFCANSLVSDDSDLFYTPPQKVDEIERIQQTGDSYYESKEPPAEQPNCRRSSIVRDMNAFRQKLKEAFQEDEVPDYIDGIEEEENQVISNIEALLLKKEPGRVRAFLDNAVGFSADKDGELSRDGSSVTSCFSDSPMDEINATKRKKEAEPLRQVRVDKSPRKKSKGKESQFSLICSAVTALSSGSSSKKSTKSSRGRKRSIENEGQSFPSGSSKRNYGASLFPPRSDTLVYPSEGSPAKEVENASRPKRFFSVPIGNVSSTESLPKRSSSLFERISGSLISVKTKDLSRKSPPSIRDSSKDSLSSPCR